MPDTILLTGAAGFIGSHLTERLLDDGASVVGVDNFDPFYDPAEKRANLVTASRHPRFTLVEADCADLPGLRNALADREFEVIVHLAAKAGVRPSIEDPMAYARANLTATQAVLQLARERETRRFIFGGSSSVYGNNRKVPFAESDPVTRPISPYAATKRAGELLCHTFHHLFGISVLSLRFFTVYGPRQRPDLAIRKFGTLMLRGEPVPMFGDGSTERDYTWIGDIINGVSSAIRYTAEHPDAFEVINLGGSRTTDLRRLIQLIGDALGVDPEIRQLPMQPGDVLRTYADVSKARSLLGYDPSTDIEDGIPRFARWLEGHPRP
ncbi:MAG: GDP-mannose 4,6-dehydratase [Gemmatimonadota bacterium]|jgi:UDP-glucuronate 4-epimerase